MSSPVLFFNGNWNCLPPGRKPKSLSGTWKWDCTKVRTENLRAALQSAIDGVAAGQCDAIAIGYGLCNRGIVGLQARALPVVIPRAHDCIGMLLGSSRCYLAQLEAQPGTYFQSAGWLENSPANGEVRQQNFTFGPNSNVTREQLVEKYGEENADYLLEQFNNFTQHYERLAFIATPVPEAAKWEKAAQKIAHATRLEIRAAARRPRLAAATAERGLERPRISEVEAGRARRPASRRTTHRRGTGMTPSIAYPRTFARRSQTGGRSRHAVAGRSFRAGRRVSLRRTRALQRLPRQSA